MVKLLMTLIDYFYFIFKRFIPYKTYKYAVCGGGNLVLDTTLYFISFQYILNKQNANLYFTVLSPHIASLFFVFPFTFVVGFLLNKYIAFPNSNIPTHIQLYRYFMVGVAALLLSYVCMKIFVDFLEFYPTPSRFLTIIITVLFSYILQTKFSFKSTDLRSTK